MKPLLSIVIANYNYGRYIEAAIQSVLSQSDERAELIVVDGGSTDESVEIIRKYANRIAWWVSEKDKGQSDAFNKGFAHANGRYLTWLNADDLLCEGALCKILLAIESHPEFEWFTGNFFRFTQDGRVIEIGWGPHIYPTFLQRPNSPLVIFGPSTFFSKKIYEEAGKIDVDYHIMMDSDLWMKFMNRGVKQRRINTFCWAFRMHEDSKTAEFDAHKMEGAALERRRRECERMHRENNYRQSKVLRWLLLFIRLLDGSLARKLVLQLTFRRYG